MIKDLVHRGVLTIINIHIHKQQKSRINEKKKKKENSTYIWRHQYPTFSSGKNSMHKINEKVEDVNDTIN